MLSSIDESKIEGVDTLKALRKELFLKMADEEYVVELENAKKLLRMYRDIFRGLGMVE